MSRKDFLNSIKVDQSVIDNCVKISRAAGEKMENGQYTTDQKEQELMHVTGFDRSGATELEESINNRNEKQIENEIGDGMENEIEGGMENEIEGEMEDGMEDGIEGGI